MLKKFLKVFSWIILIFIGLTWLVTMIGSKGISDRVIFTIVYLIIAAPFYKFLYGKSKKSKTSTNSISELNTNIVNKDTEINDKTKETETTNDSNYKNRIKYMFIKKASRKKIIISSLIFVALISFFTINYITKVKGEIKSVEITNIIPSEEKLGWVKIFFKMEGNDKGSFVYSNDIEIYNKKDWESLSDKDKQESFTGKKKYISGDIVNYQLVGVYGVNTPLYKEGDYVLAVRGYKYDTSKLGKIFGTIFSMLNNNDHFYYVTCNFTLSKDLIAKINENRSLRETKNKQEQEAKNNPLQIQDGWKWDKDGNYTYIRGSVKNISNSNIVYFKVVAEYLDANGNVLDTDYTNSGETIKPSSQKEFEIMHKHNEKYKKIRLNVEEVKYK